MHHIYPLREREGEEEMEERVREGMEEVIENTLPFPDWRWMLENKQSVKEMKEAKQ